jgi:hypothetical protein
VTLPDDVVVSKSDTQFIPCPWKFHDIRILDQFGLEPDMGVINNLGIVGIVTRHLRILLQWSTY